MTAVTVRPVTDEEVRAFDEQGWVLLPALVSPAEAATLLARARRLMGADGAARFTGGHDADLVGWTGGAWTEYPKPASDDELFQALRDSPELGRNAARLLGRDVAIRSHADTLMVKLPVDAVAERGRATGYHADSRPLDRGSLSFWLALDEITPEQGPMRFLTGSHRLGPRNGYEPNLESAFAAWPDLEELALSEPLHLKAGDATAHHSFLVHGAPANVGDRPRWAYNVGVFPGDALYTGRPYAPFDGLGLATGHAVEHESIPELYTPPHPSSGARRGG